MESQASRGETVNALILVDLQNDFLPGGALAVAKGDEVIPVANALSSLKGKVFDLVVATQDWHPKNHGSFASNNGKKVGDMGTLAGLPQVMWPDHCVQRTEGADFAPALEFSFIDRVFQKGTDPEIDSYSGFFDNGHKKATGLGDFLKQRGVTDVTVLGLATDYCVKFTALDALMLGFQTTLVKDGCRAVNLRPDDEMKAIEEIQNAGARVVLSAELVARGRS